MKILVGVTLAFLVMLAFGLWSLHGPDKWRIIAALPAPVRHAGEFVLREIEDSPYLVYRFGPTGLPTYDIRVDSEDLKKLNENLPAFDQILSDEYQTYVPAIFVHGGREYKVDVRYRGATSGHWAYPKKSIRVRFQDSDLFNGKKAINLIVPEDRGFVAEELNHFRARRLGFLTPDSGFAAVSINGKKPALYFEAEQIGSEWLKRQDLARDANLYGEKYLFQPLYTDSNFWRKYARNSAYPENDYTDIAALLDLLAGDDDTVVQKIFTLLDQDSFYAWSIWAILARSNAQGSIHNMRLYVDPALKGRFRIVAWDLGFDGFTIKDPWVFEESDNPMLLKILRHPQFMAERNARLWAYLKDEKHLEDDLAYFDKQYEAIRKAVYQDRIKEYSNRYFDGEVQRLRNVFEHQFRSLRNLFVESKAACRVIDRISQIPAVELRTRSLAPLSVGSRAIEPNIIEKIHETGFERPDPPTIHTFAVGERVTEIETSLDKIQIYNAFTGSIEEIECAS